MLNMVEENAYAQSHRALQTAGRLKEQAGSLGNTLALLDAAGFRPEEMAAALPAIRVEPVLTAHPTEAKRASILAHHRELYLLLVKRENRMWTPAEQREIREQIAAVLERLWRTGEIYLRKPEVKSEVQDVLHYLSRVFPSILPLLSRRLADAWDDAGYDMRLLKTGRPFTPQITFGNWVGGDRDGHPFVTADVTAQTLAMLRRGALDLLRGELTGLGARLSLSNARQSATAALTDAIDSYAANLGKAGDTAVHRNPGEPWRQFINLMIARLPENGMTSTAYRSAGELAADLDLLSRSLSECGASRLAETDLTPVSDMVRSFGFHLAALDIRQNSRFHDLAIAQLMVAAGLDGGDFPTWSEARRLEFITEELRLHDRSPGPECRSAMRPLRFWIATG
ncbi:MAG: phosphoenolpyruvate carboxylase [Rhodospirillales bacterium]|nr:phosphoenolpyruvate carboxylase [Rhodospirillales bacterium]